MSNTDGAAPAAPSDGPLTFSDAVGLMNQPPKDDNEPATTKVTILSELDSYITERMKEQPSTLEEVASRIDQTEFRPAHRLKLPAYFESFSVDTKPPGPFGFRWIFKHKQSVNRHLSEGWLFVNRSYFPDAPRYLFTANGGIEVGDAILGFLPAKRVLEIRQAPGLRSRERLRSQVTPVSPDYSLMTGNQESEHVYAAKLGPEVDETTEAPVPGVLTEGRDIT